MSGWWTSARTHVSGRLPLVAASASVVALVAAVGVAVFLTYGRSDVQNDCPKFNSASGDGDRAAAPKQLACIPGTFFPSQGRSHFPDLSQAHTPTPFCAGVAHSRTLAGDMPDPTADAGVGVVAAPPTNCYASNPPSSGRHLNVQRNVNVGGGVTIDIPPHPGVYPDDVEIPRDAIPHILEHAGVFGGWNCAVGDAACMSVVDRLKAAAGDRIDNHDDRAVVAHDSDLPRGTIALAAWTRVDSFPYDEFTAERAETFIARNSCRFDPEGFCR